MSHLAAWVIELPGGRHLGYAEHGDPAAIPVICFHGTPGSRLQIEPPPGLPLPSGFRLIAPDRPGYGYSTFYRARRLTDWPADVAALADHLGLGRFAVMGVSGGGPHVLACAHALADRLIGVGCVSGVAPLGDPQTSEGMMPLNRMITTLSRRAPWLLSMLFNAQMSALKRNPRRLVDTMMRQMPEPDRLLMNEGLRALFIKDIAMNSATAGRAAAQDFELFSGDWGFRLEDIRLPVHLWQGSLDRNVPAQHAELLAARIPNATLHRCEGEGHLLFLPRLGEILRTITT
jgi:pimeloyl-ACP methyl ester carboxylesterase